MEESKAYIGKRIREAREEAGKTQEEVGKVLKYTPMGISHFENGIRELKFKDLEALAKFFQKPLTFFLPAQHALDTTLLRADANHDPKIKLAVDAFDAFLDKIGRDHE